MQYAPWLRHATDIVSNIASQEVRNVLLELKDSVEQKGTSLFTPSPGIAGKTIYEIMAANIVAGERDNPEDNWLNLNNYSREAKLTHRSEFSAASELLEFQDAEDEKGDEDEELRRKNAHLLGLDAFDAMLNDEDFEDSDSNIDWEALFQDESFLEEPSDAAATNSAVADEHEHETTLQPPPESSQVFENGASSETGALRESDGVYSGFNPLDLCASSRVEAWEAWLDSFYRFDLADAADYDDAAAASAAAAQLLSSR